MGMSNEKLIDLRWPFGGLCKMNLVVWVHVSGEQRPYHGKPGAAQLLCKGWGSRHEEHPLFSVLEGSLRGGAGAEKLALAAKLHRGSEEMGRVLAAQRSAPGRDEGLLTAPPRAGELGAHGSLEKR